MRVHPYAPGAPAGARDSGEGSHRHRVIAAEDDRDVPCALDVGHDLREVKRYANDLVDVVRPTVHLGELVLVHLAKVLRRALVTIGDADVSAVADRVAK